MKSIILFLTTLCYCCLLASGVEAQQQKKTTRPPQKVSQSRQPAKQRDADKAQTEVGQQEEPAPPPVRKMTDDERVLSWRGEKVVIGAEKIWDHVLDCNGASGGPLPPNDYNGKTGVIIESTPNPESFRYPMGKANLVIALDSSGERISCSSTESLLFLSELGIAEALAGRSLWTKGTLRLVTDEGRYDDIPPTKQITVTKVNWHQFGAYLDLRVDKRERTLVVMNKSQMGTCMDKRFHLGESCTHVWSPTKFFYDKDPHELYRGWSKAIWRSIGEGKIAIGMTEKMVEAACGANLYYEGKILILNNVPGLILFCRGTGFLMQKGKVTKFVK